MGAGCCALPFALARCGMDKCKLLVNGWVSYPPMFIEVEFGARIVVPAID